ncbi:MAG: Uma2 family endonuclease [Anaerolineae bacterium]|nr:Uma2 family endonuclease [Anaerolineae bacterium]
MAAQPKQRYTPEEYLALERQAEYKSEYVDGEIYAMAGASEAHDFIAGEIYAALLVAFRGGPCAVLSSDVKVRVTGRRYVYPDVVAVCGERRYADDQKDVLLNPTVVFEVLSPSTELYDRGQKLEFYRSLPSLKDYVLVAQHRPSLELYSRQADNTWQYSDVRGLHSHLYIPSIDCTLALAEVYQRVQVREGDE